MSSLWTSWKTRYVIALTRVAIVRVDRMGDSLIARSAVDCARALCPDVAVVTRREHAAFFPVPTIVYEQDFWALVVALHGYDAIVHLHLDRKVLLAARCAGIKRSIGPGACRWESLLLTERVWQKRSRVEKHEAAYNEDLVARLGSWGHVEHPVLQLGRPLQSFDVLIHPGMGGSALNWPLMQYQALVQELQRIGKHVAVSIGPQDRALREAFDCPIIEGSLEELASAMQSASLVIAPGTGPLHLAASLGRKTLGIYPTLRVQGAKRWGPLAGEVIAPDVICPASFQCLGKKCEHYLCMEKLDVQTVVAKVLTLLSK